MAFANEVGRFSHAVGVDSHRLMEIFCKDTKQNLSSYYFKPGYAFGGSCLPKDLRATVYAAQQHDVEVPILRATLESNRKQIERAFRMVMATGHRKVGVLGMSFKAGTDDLRESPMVALIEMLIGKGCAVSIYDRDVSESRTMGANREYVEREIPHIWSLMRSSLPEVLRESDTVVIGNRSDEYAGAMGALSTESVIIDLAGVSAASVNTASQYQGINW